MIRCSQGFPRLIKIQKQFCSVIAERDLPKLIKNQKSSVLLSNHFLCYGCENFCPLQRSFGPFGSKVAKRVRNEFPGPLGPGGPNSRNESKKSQIVEKMVNFDFASNFLDARGREAPRTHFELFWPLWAQRAQIRHQKINANFFWTEFSKNPSGHGCRHPKSWTSAPKAVFLRPR